MARKGKDRNSIKKRRRLLILGTFSLTTIVFTTYTMGKYWVQIYDKKQERDKLSQELKKLKKNFVFRMLFSILSTRRKENVGNNSNMAYGC